MKEAEALDAMRLVTEKLVREIRSSDKDESELAEGLAKVLLRTWAEGAKRGLRGRPPKGNGHDLTPGDEPI